MNAPFQSEYAVICVRAAKIADRLMPMRGEAFSGFYHREAFVARCRRRDARDKLYKRVFWALVSKGDRA